MEFQMNISVAFKYKFERINLKQHMKKVPTKFSDWRAKWVAILLFANDLGCLLLVLQV